jgi:pimeloyl-ACP methyl ester carboxylesterase
LAEIVDAFAEVNGIRLHYITKGSGQLLVFLHGFPEFWYAWRAQIDAFADRFQVVAPDMRGYNLSDKPSEIAAYAIPELVGDIRALIEHLSPGRQAILVAHDWGGVVAWSLAMAHPGALEKLVIVNAPHPGILARELQSNPAQLQASGYMQALRDPRAEQMLAADNFARLDRVLFDGAARPDVFADADREAYHAAWSQPDALTGAVNYYRALGLAPVPSPQAMIVHVPTLVLWGEKDTALLTGNLDGLDAFVPHLHIERFPDATHWIVHEQPEAVNRAIGAFIG